MNSLLYYLFEVNCSLVIGAVLYFLVFRQLSFFQWNRYFILGLCLLSLLLPFGTVRLGELFLSPTSPVLALEQSNTVAHSIRASGDLVSETEMVDSFWHSFSIGYGIAYGYLLVSFVLLCRFALRYIRLVRRIGQLSQYNFEGFTMVAPFGHYANCSVQHVIVMEEDQLNTPDGKLIFEHESQHIVFKHRRDKLFIEVFRCLFWLNPFVYWMRRQLYLVHEYQVDEVLANRYGNSGYARFLLTLTQQSCPAGLQSSLFNNRHELVERVQAMMATPSSKKKRWQYVLTVPLLGLLLLFYSFINPPMYSWSIFYSGKDRTTKTIVLDPGHGGKDTGATAYSGLMEKSLTWETCVLLKQELEHKGYKVILSRAGDEFKLLKDRSNFEGDLLLSIHFDHVETREELPIRILYQSGFTNDILEQHNHRFAFSLDQKLKQNGLSVNRPQISTKHVVLRGAKIPALLLELDNINAIDKNVKPEFVHKLAQAVDQSFED
ncbi:N-acetylmuramoyl-L-alanine amidase [Sphingobacterium sp. WOUb80]|uniref:N-acetylmuramoyl-L-alanine amidase n=1 Tax=Sphingobacterium sp. WOUb80 TaxID=3234028 RepID=UPI003CEF15C0